MKPVENMAVYGRATLQLALLWARDLTRVLPLRVRFALAKLCFLVMYLLLARQRQAVRNNLHLVLKRQPGHREVLRVFLDYARYWAENADPLTYWRKAVRRFEGDPFPSPGEQFIGLTLHIGNFELFGPALHQALGRELFVVTEALRPRVLTRYFAARRQAYHIRGIPHDCPRDIVTVLRNGDPLGVVCDRVVGGQGVAVRMFGTTLRLPLSIVHYALKHRIAINVAYCVRFGATIIVYNKRLSRSLSPTQTLAAIGTVFEEAICRYPFQWHVLEPLSSGE